MTRPEYETDEDLKNEIRIGKIIAAERNCKVHKMDKRQKIDFMLLRDDKAIGWAEIKCRSGNYPWDKIDRLGGFMISLNKAMAGIQKAQTTGLPFVLIAEAEGEIRIATLSDGASHFALCDVIMSGRKDRNDPLDIEPQVLIPVYMFKKLKGE